MNSSPKTAFVRDFQRLPVDAEDSRLDELVGRHFNIDAKLAPDLIRAYLRRAMNRPEIIPGLWDAFMALEHDLEELSPPRPSLAESRPWARPGLRLAA